MYQFYIALDGAQFGPYTAKEVKELDLTPDIMVRQEGSNLWQRADSYNFIALANDEFVESLTGNRNNVEAPNSMSSRISLRSDESSYAQEPVVTYSQPSVQSNAGENILLPCPECGQLSDSLKCFTLPNYALFLGIYAQWQNIQYICCPSCMRKHIGIKCFTYNILLANLLWPVFILPWGVTQLIRSGQKGHTTTVKNMLND